MVNAIATSEQSELFDDQEKAVIAFSRELTETARVSDSAFERVRASLDERQLVELVLNVGAANFNNRFTHAFWTELETS